MKKNLMLVVISLVSLIGLYSCNPNSLTNSIHAENVRAMILVTDDGVLTFCDAKGEPLKPCILPKPDVKSEKTQSMVQDQGGEDLKSMGVCQGMEKGSAVTAIQTISILKTNSTNCITLGPDASGHLYQFCW